MLTISTHSSESRGCISPAAEAHGDVEVVSPVRKDLLTGRDRGLGAVGLLAHELVLVGQAGELAELGPLVLPVLKGEALSLDGYMNGGDGAHLVPPGLWAELQNGRLRYQTVTYREDVGNG